MIEDIILEGELLKSKALDQNDPNLLESEYIDKVCMDVEEWIERAKKDLSSNYPNCDINLDELRWKDIGSKSREALSGFIESKLLKMRPLIKH